MFFLNQIKWKVIWKQLLTCNQLLTMNMIALLLLWELIHSNVVYLVECENMWKVEFFFCFSLFSKWLLVRKYTSTETQSKTGFTSLFCAISWDISIKTRSLTNPPLLYWNKVPQSYFFFFLSKTIIFTQ